MLDYLVNHALQNVWCNPMQDRSAIVEIFRMTKPGGEKNKFSLMWRDEPMPEKGIYFHVYGLGQTAPGRLNLDATMGEWIKLTDHCTASELIADIYTTQGLKVNPAWVWVKRTVQKFYLIAIRKQNTTPIILDDIRLWLRLYSNSYWSSIRSGGVTPKVVVEGSYVDGVANILTLQQRYLAHRNLNVGRAYAFKNGFYVNNFLPGDNVIGDHIHWVYDAAIKAVYDFRLDELQTFVSALDSTRKYLLHPPKDLELIDYQDDVDVFIIEKMANGKERGVYYHRNDPRSIRMVTHHDYALSVDFVQTYIDDNPEWLGNPNVYIRLHVRHSGYARPLIDEHHRIKELYKLTDQQIVAAMLGLDSTIPEWRAAELEVSNYTRIMRSRYDDVTSAEVVDAYGYNAIAKIIADSPLRVENESVLLPAGLRVNSTIYEYDAQGLLLGWRIHYSGDVYYTYYPQTVLVEGVVGLGGTDASMVMGVDPVTLDPNQSYRMYVSPFVNGLPTQAWIDVTGDQDYYTVADGVLTWLIDPAGQIGVVKGNRNFISYDLLMSDQDMAYRFSVNHTPIQGTVLHIPPGRIDLYLNGRALREDLDYKVVYPEIVLCNKEYLLPNAQTQHLHIRCTGFAEPDGSRVKTTEYGFVVHQKLSVDNTYNIRDDKVKRIIVDGRTIHRDQLNFEENSHEVNMPGIAEGRPYFIEDVVVPIRGVSEFNNYVLRQRSQQVDQRVSDYLGIKIPDPVYPNQPIIPRRYWVYSPLVAKLIADINAGFLVPPVAGSDEATIAQAVQPYLIWLPYDPSLDDNIDLRFVNIHPHPESVVIEISRDGYLFLERVIALYLRNRVDNTNFLSIVH